VPELSQSQSLATALLAGGITVVLLLLVVLAGALIGRSRSDRPGAPILKNLLGTALIMLVPFAAAVPLAALGGAALRATGAAPLVYLFIALAGLSGLIAAIRANGYGMEGCTKGIGIFAGLYTAVWGVVAFAGAGGPEPGLGLAWLKPPLAALPFALAFTAMAGRKRTNWTFPLAWATFMAFMAVCYLPIEAGVGAGLLPGSDWLRFPLAGLAIGAILSAVQLLALVGGSKAVRAKRLRAMPRQTLLFALLVAPTGLAWAAARALCG
jgi:hypothetical protein